MTSGVRRCLIATILLLVVAGCDSNTKAAGPGATSPVTATTAPAATTPPATATTTPTATDTFDGTWTGMWSRTSPPQTTNKITFVLHQSGSSITGTVDVVGAICLTKGAVTGSATGSSITLHAVTPAAVGGGQATGDWTGTRSGDHLTGALTGTCSQGVGVGTWDVTRS